MLRFSPGAHACQRRVRTAWTSRARAQRRTPSATAARTPGARGNSVARAHSVGRVQVAAVCTDGR